MRLLKIVCFIAFVGFELQAQDPLRFKVEVATLTANDNLVNKKKLILFTGSSSIRIWKELPATFPKKNILNRGFGGSEMADLVYYFDQLILPYQPTQIFIYEGDNDLAMGRSIDQILGNAEQLLTLIRAKLPATVQVVFISTKPSLSRWSLKEKYIDFNRQLKDWTKKQKGVSFIDVWTPMLDAKGEVQQDLFLEDGLHMNEKGYAIWKKVIGTYIK